MKNKGLQIAVLSALFIGSAYLLLNKRIKQTNETLTGSSEPVSSKSGEFTISTATSDNKTTQTVFWQENGKYYKRCKNALAICVDTEITKSQYDKYYNTYLN